MAGKVMRLDLLNSESYVVVFLFAIIFTDGGVYFCSKNKRIFSQYLHSYYSRSFNNALFELQKT